ncbi:MAG: hypothetical protein U1F41_04130 [Burkholderiales bacterium]
MDHARKTVAATFGARRVLLLDSITWLDEQDAGQVVVSGSHGGRSAGEYAVRWPLALCCLNDAGVGKDRAGIAALDMLEARGTPALAYGHMSARIGEARDAWEHGVISHVNALARALGFAPGLRLRDAIARIAVTRP